MKHKTLLAIVAVILCSCADKNVPAPAAVIGFEYERISPLMVQFTNTSSGFESYKWDFGDGTWSYGKDATKTYETIGTYPVTLTATAADGSKYDHRVTVEITQPDIYIIGYILYAIPYDNRYYRLVFKDDAILPSSWDWVTAYTPLLDETDIPYPHYLQNPVMILNPNSHSYWKVQVMRNVVANSNSGDVTCLTGKITKAQLLEYRPEYTLQTESGNCAVGIYMGYDY